MFIIGWKHRTILPIAYLGKESLDDTFDKRLYSYHPSSQNVLVIFTAFQIKNLYDAIVFNDGPEFLAHHIASLFCSIGALFNRVANCYGVFFMGISELSTALVCLLANFDHKHGIVDLDKVFPNIRLFIGVIFIGLFFIFRIIVWSILFFQLFKDSWKALKRNSKKESLSVKILLETFIVCGSGVTILQFVWLRDIVNGVRNEF